MNQREKLLIGAVACAVVLFLGQMFYRGYRTGLSKLDKDVSNAKKELADVDLKLKQAHLAESKLAAWRTQSLPNDPKHPNDSRARERAYQLYSEWLGNTLEKESLKPDKTQAMSTTGLSSTIGTIAVHEEMKGSLTNLVEFLYKFYSAPMLHQITRLELRPDPNKPDSDNLKMMMQVEALMLPESENAKVPPDGKLNPFQLADVSDYRVAIGGRKVFSPYKRPIDDTVVTTTPGREQSIEDLRFAKFTGTHLGTKGLIAWIYRMNTGDTLLVSEGDPVTVGTWKAKVVSVEPRAVTFERDGKRTKVDIGSLIKDGKAVAMPAKVPEADSSGDDGGDVNALIPEADI